jgi:para-aminobenzoate synthetase component 1
VHSDEPYAWFGGLLATDLLQVTDDPKALDGDGWWAVCITYEGRATFAQFGQIVPAPLPKGQWQGPSLDSWSSSLDECAYVDAVTVIKEHIAAGDIYQGNVCRVMRASLPQCESASAPTSPLMSNGGTQAKGEQSEPSQVQSASAATSPVISHVATQATGNPVEPSPAQSASPRNLAGLAHALAAGNPAPYAGVVNLPAHNVQVVTASPELFLAREGRSLTSQPIKGTAVTADAMLAKDVAENIMIVDLVRNDLSVVCEPGSVDVPHIVQPESHPGLVHLVSTVTGQLRDGLGWTEILAAMFPPGSVTGCPKPRAIELLAQVERSPRGPYCGAIGWVDAGAQLAQLAVGIRTFWVEGSMLCFGTGAGITAGSDAHAEWAETQLKAQNLVRIASQNWNAV